MAHFGVQKAKKMLALAGVTAIVGTGLISSSNVSALDGFDSLVLDTDYACSESVASERAVALLSSNAIKWAVKEQNKYLEACSETWLSTPSSAKFYIPGGTYTFDELVTRTNGTGDSRIIIGEIPAVFGNSRDLNNGDTVTFDASSNSVGLNAISLNDAVRLTTLIEENHNLVINKGIYNGMYINSEGSITINDGVFVDTDFRNDGGEFTINDGNFDFSNNGTSNIGRSITNSGTLLINNGYFKAGAHDYRINTEPVTINNFGTATIKNGTFEFDYKNTSGEIGSSEQPYYGEPGGLIRNSKNLTIEGGKFGGRNGNPGGGTVINTVSDDSFTSISGGDFEANYIYTNWASGDDYKSDSSNSRLTVTGGVFKSKNTFFVYDNKDNLPKGAANSDSLGLFVDEDNSDNVLAGWRAGTNGARPINIDYLNPNSVTIKGGDFSDGENIEPYGGYAKIELATDYDGDGNKDIRVVPQAGPISYYVDLGATTELKYHVKDGSPRSSFPEGSRISSQENTEYCSAEFVDGKLYVTGHKYTDGDSSKFCHIFVTDDSSYVLVYYVSTTPETDYNYTEAGPIVIPEGESKTPEGYDGDAEDYEWIIANGDEFCTVDNGTITAVKGGGSCTIVARNDETKEVIIWEITTTSPIEIGVGESKKPEDLPEGAENGKWTSSDSAVCTVTSDGTITGVKAGTCKVTLELEDGTIYTWVVTITENPDTADKNNSTVFMIVGAMTAGFAAIAVTARRFFGRN